MKCRSSRAPSSTRTTSRPREASKSGRLSFPLTPIKYTHDQEFTTFVGFMKTSPYVSTSKRTSSSACNKTLNVLSTPPTSHTFQSPNLDMRHAHSSISISIPKVPFESIVLRLELGQSVFELLQLLQEHHFLSLVLLDSPMQVC